MRVLHEKTSCATLVNGTDLPRPYCLQKQGAPSLSPSLFFVCTLDHEKKANRIFDSVCVREDERAVGSSEMEKGRGGGTGTNTVTEWAEWMAGIEITLHAFDVRGRLKRKAFSYSPLFPYPPEPFEPNID